MKTYSLILICGLLALLALAGCPRDTGTDEGGAVMQTDAGGDQSADSAAASAAGSLPGGDESPETADDTAMDEQEDTGEMAEEQTEAGEESMADGTEKADGGTADEGATMTDEQSTEGVTTVVLETTKGNIVMEVHEDWAPLGAQRFLQLVEDGYYDNTPFFRVIEGFVAQFGLSPNAELKAKWGENALADDPVVQGNEPGYVAYAMAGPNTRTTQIFINYGDNSPLDRQGFACFAKVVTGMDVARQLHKCEWGDQQGLTTPEGVERFKQQFPQADWIKRAYIK
jgi:peptidyl-prolyl cis-trans isomerase A (cyclophilin A)